MDHASPVIFRIHIKSNNIPSNEVKLINGYAGHSALPLFDYQAKFDRQAEYTGVRRIFRVPGDRVD